MVKYDNYLVRIEFTKPVVDALSKKSGLMEAWVKIRQQR